MPRDGALDLSKRRDMRYRSGRSKTWLKVKNPKSPAMLRWRMGRSDGERNAEILTRPASETAT
jgi:hypothetical protein